MLFPGSPRDPWLVGCKILIFSSSVLFSSSHISYKKKILDTHKTIFSSHLPVSIWKDALYFLVAVGLCCFHIQIHIKPCWIKNEPHKDDRQQHVNCGLSTTWLPKMAQSIATRLQYQSYHQPSNTHLAPSSLCVLLYHYLTWATCLYIYPLQSLHCLSELTVPRHKVCYTLPLPLIIYLISTVL